MCISVRAKMPLSAFENSATIIFTECCLNKWIKNYKAFVGMCTFSNFPLGSHSTLRKVRSNFVGFHFSRLTQLQNSISENRICPLGNGQKDTVSLLRGLCSRDPRDEETQLDPAIWKKRQTPLGISKLHLAEGLVMPAGVCLSNERQITFTYYWSLKSCYKSHGTEFTSKEEQNGLKC